VKALKRADAVNARHHASQHARQAAVSQTSSARTKKTNKNINGSAVLHRAAFFWKKDDL
jgi:hypothetical protein